VQTGESQTAGFLQLIELIKIGGFIGFMMSLKDIFLAALLVWLLMAAISNPAVSGILEGRFRKSLKNFVLAAPGLTLYGIIWGIWHSFEWLGRAVSGLYGRLMDKEEE
jgi:hypothetical protein